MLLLYDNAASTNAIKVRFLAAELGLELATEEVSLEEPRPATYLEVHPFGLLPALRDDDLLVTESNTILRYLAEREGRADLRGDTPARRARVDVLLDSLSLELRPWFWEVEEIVVYGEPLGDDELHRRRAKLQAQLEAYERLLDPDGPHAVGAFTIADCAIAGRALHLLRLGLDESCLPRITRTLAAARERGAYRHAVA